MPQEHLVIRTKLIPPRLHKRILHRPRLTRRLLEALDYRLTILQAGAGYGKSTALAALAREEYPLVWYRLEAEDAPPLFFLLHLIYGFKSALPGLSDEPVAMLEAWERNGEVTVWTSVIDVLVNILVEQIDDQVILVLDDVHFLSEAAESVQLLNRLIERAPSNLHIFLSTRYPLNLPVLVSWRVRGEILQIEQDELAFSPQEMSLLFRDQYGLALNSEQVAALESRVEGWPITLPLIRQQLQSGAAATLSQALAQLSNSTEDLFVFLTQEVLNHQSQEVREFLELTAVLREMTADICNCLRAAGNSAQILRYLLENELFVVDLGDGHARYHNLFRDLLCHHLPPEVIREIHLKAAACYRQREEREGAVYHFLAAGKFDEAANILNKLGYAMVQTGRLDKLVEWIGALPPSILENYPRLLVYLGDIARLHSRFDEAEGWYQQAEERYRARRDISGIARALRGRARVYLDTVDPKQAINLLQESLRLSDGQEDRESRARLLELMAENMLNLGRLEDARTYRSQARELREEGPGEAELPTRILLRTGCLDQACRILEERAEREKQEPALRPRAHRETFLLLSIVLAFQGEGEKAYYWALEGTERGKALQSPFITAVGIMRQGHAWLLKDSESGYDEACRRYRETIALSESLMVPRLKVEAFLGLCRAHGFQRELEMARQAAEQGIELARMAGDEWIEACIRLAMGAGYTLAGQYDTAAAWLSQAKTIFRECSDTFGETCAMLWLCLVWHNTNDTARLARGVDDLLRLVQTYNYDFLFKRKSFFGPPDPHSLIPMLLLARKTGRQSACAERLLTQIDLGQLEIHPGYQLRIYALGPFRVWRGAYEIAPQSWQRKTALQLFQLLLTYRRRLLDRDQITEMLWPELDPKAARRNLKVALSTLNRVLEPDRPSGALPAYVLRDGSLYGLRPEADLWLDIDQFDRLIAAGDRRYERLQKEALPHYRQALALYQGEYLQEQLYETWCSEERERLLTLYLRTADRLAHALIEWEAWQEAIDVCQAILARDDCWEQAYRLMITAYTRQGNRVQALRSYQRCEECLRQELGIEPTEATVQLSKTIL